MNEKYRKTVGYLFEIASLCFVFGTINHILNTGESIISSLLLASGCALGAYVCLKK